MIRALWLGVAIVLTGAVLDQPGLVLVGALALLPTVLTGVWAHHGGRALHYRRHLRSHRALWGDQVPLSIELWNRKLLPVPLVTTRDHVTEGLTVVERRLDPLGDGEAVLQNAWSLLWYEKVIRHFRILADHRGVFRFGSIGFAVADVFGHDVSRAEQLQPAGLVVMPRMVPVRHASAARAPFGGTRARNSLFHDSALFAGVRPYQSGDTLRQRHWRASARLGRPVTKQFEPVRDRTLIIVVDGQTVEGPHWMPDVYPDVLEGIGVAAASLARSALVEGNACGLALAIRTGTRRDLAYLPPRTGQVQMGRIGGILAGMGQNVSAPFSALLAALPRRVPSGATLVTLSVRLPESYLRALQRLRRSGFTVEHVALGECGEVSAQRLRAGGIPASFGRLDPDWRRADALILAA